MRKLFFWLILFITACNLTSVKARKFNFVFTTRDIIKNPENDLTAYSKIIIDNKITNATQPAPMSSPQTCRLKLSPGNHLVKVIKYVKDPSDRKFKPLQEKYQPRRRFAKTFKKKITFFSIKYTENSCRYRINVHILTNKFYNNYFRNR
ncbi:MAG TPA: hypothetical protein VKS21_10920 [Spirochaetota bacterium]|nr:hypothetical protein [Spirochaetota bacterium]